MRAARPVVFLADNAILTGERSVLADMKPRTQRNGSPPFGDRLLGGGMCFWRPSRSVRFDRWLVGTIRRLGG